MPSDQAEEINIVPLGESGVGKSTFINSCFNYLKYRTLQDVLNNKLQVLIPARINIEDQNGVDLSFDVNIDRLKSEESDGPNENLEAGKSATQDVHLYVFPIELNNKKYKVRILDTPGMGDTEGAEQDKTNCDLILAYLSQLKEIHAFCILLHPAKSRLDGFMNYCIVQILARLDSSAVNNIAFIFTNTRGQNFTPGMTKTTLRVLLDDIKEKNNIDVPFSSLNTFCFDNEAFRYVAAIKHGVKLKKFVQSVTEMSWDESSNEFWRLLSFITQLRPHDPKKTITLNEARTMMSQLSGPVTEIVQRIQDNITKTKELSEELSKIKLTKETLIAKMYTPKIEIKIERLTSPLLVCTHSSCVSTYEVDGVRKTHYKQICCENCRTLFGRGALAVNLPFTSWGFKCRYCKHPKDTHKCLFYKTKVMETKEDKSLIPAIKTQENLVKLKEDVLRNLENLQKEYEEERQYILQSCVIFGQFVNKNSVRAVGSPIENYVNMQITRDGSNFKTTSDKTVLNLQKLLAEYEREKLKLGRPIGNQEVTHDEIEKRKIKLLHLKHLGPKIKELYDLHKAAAKKGMEKKETIVDNEKKWFKNFKNN